MAARRQILRESLSSELFLHGRRNAPHRPAGPIDQPRLHADGGAPHAGRDPGAFPRLPHLRRAWRHGRRPISGRWTGRWPARAAPSARPIARVAGADVRLAVRRRHPPGAGRQPRQERLRAMVKFQQLSAPTAAKSVEDTSFYRFRPADLPQRGRHRAVAVRHLAGRLPRGDAGAAPSACPAPCWPRPRTTTSAARIRAPALAVISEIPGEWEAALTRWTRLNAPLKKDLDGPAPDVCDEIMLYESLVGAWPLGLSAATGMAWRRWRNGWRRGRKRRCARASGTAAGRSRIPSTKRPAETSCIRSWTAGPRLARVAGRSRTSSNGSRAPGAVNALSQAAAADHLARRAGPVSGYGILGFQPGRSRTTAGRSISPPVQASLQAATAPADLLPHLEGWPVVKQGGDRTRALRYRAAMPAACSTEGSYTPLKRRGPRARPCAGVSPGCTRDGRYHRGHAAAGGIAGHRRRHAAGGAAQPCGIRNLHC